MIPSTNHNEALSGDTLYSAFLNHEWREIVLPFVIAGMEKIANSIEDESDRQDFEVRYGAMIDDFYNEDIVDNTPVGTILTFVGLAADIPAKYLLCNGDELVGTDYPELFAIMPAAMISGSNFTLPALSNRFVRHTVNDSDVGDFTGELNHTLTVAELPAHHHVVPAHAHTVGTRPAAGSNAGSVSLGSLAANGTIATDTEPATDTSDTGSGSSFGLIPPSQSFLSIIKALP